MSDEPRFVLTAHAQEGVLGRNIKSEWIELTLFEPTQLLRDGRDPTIMHALRAIPEYENRVLRVIYNATVHPVRVVTVFFDRRLKGTL